MERVRVLHIEDNPADAAFLQEMLAEAENISFDLEWKDRLSTGLERLTKIEIDVVLLDLNLPDSRGFVTFTKTHAQAPKIPIVILTGLPDEKLALKAVHEGAQDYLIKSHIDSDLLIRTIRYAIERKYAERVLTNYAANLEKANQLKDLFTDIMRHDILNPLGVIKLASEQLLVKGMDAESSNSLLMIKRNADKLIDMVKSASMYTILMDAEKLEKSIINLNDIFRETANDFMSQIEEKNMKLGYLSKGECYVMANPMIESIFSNLLSNAIKYSPPGGKIEVSITDENEHCKIYIKDWGYGIKDEDKGKLFTRFTRLDKKGVKGTGLGLAIVKRVVELHDGKVWIEDNPEGGSVFYVQIPKK
jgi:signal transduction histidine kinase